MAFDYRWYRLRYRDPSETLVEVIIISETDGPSYDVSGFAELEYPEVDYHLKPIRGCSLRLNLQATEGVDYERLWTANERTFQVIMRIAGNIKFVGFVKPDGIFRDYTSPNYNINIDCIGGLGFLENLSYTDENGLQYTGIAKGITIIANCLKRTGLSREIYVNSNVVYDTLLDTDEVLANARFKQERYYRDDNETPMDCKEVLEDLLEIFGLCVAQSKGHWWVYDPEKIAENGQSDTTYFVYDKNGNYVRQETEAHYRKIGSHINGFTDHFHINRNQRLETRPPISGIRVNYKYGLDESLLNNEFLDHNDVSYTGWTINDPTKHTFGPNNRGARIGHDESVVVMTAAAIALAQDDLIMLELQYVNDGTPAANRGVSWRVRIGTSHYLKNNGQWSTSATTNTTEVLSGQTGIISVVADPLPAAGNVILEIMGFEFVTTTQGNYLLTRASIMPGEGGNVVPLEGEFHTTQIPGGSVVEDNREVFNGDNETALYYGTTYKLDGVTPTLNWRRKGETEDRRLLALLSEKIVRLNQSPMRYFTGDVYGLLDYVKLIEIDGFDNANFMIMGFRLNTKTRTASVQLRQIFNTELTNEIYEFTLDYGKTVKPTVIG